jgi:hypothetical protein
MLKHIRAGNCQMLSMWESSRGSRQMGEWVAFLDLCRDHGTLIRIFGGDDPQTFDPRRQRDREALLREGINNESETERLAPRVRGGMRDAAFLGKPAGPRLYGYCHVYDDRGKLAGQVIDDEPAARVRKCARDTLAGKSLHGQARGLNRAGILSPLGGQWTGHGLARMLINPGYIGTRVHNGEVIATEAWPAILTEKQHRQLVVLLGTPGRRSFDGGSPLRHYLSGATRCGCCGGVLRTGTSAGKPKVKADRRYICRNPGCGRTSARIDYMNEAVEAQVRARLREPDAAAIFAPASDDTELVAAQAEAEDLRTRLAEFRAEGRKPRGLSAAAVAEAERGLVPLIEAAERRVTLLSVPPALAKYADDPAGKWDTLPVGVQREFVLALADVVLSPVGKGGRWSLARLGTSRWHGDPLTWADHWAA